jgi:hypothetical protein
MGEAAIGPEGVMRQLADGIAFPNGMAVTEELDLDHRGVLRK